MKDVLLAVGALAAATVTIVAVGLTFLWFGHMALIALDAVWTAARGIERVTDRSVHPLSLPIGSARIAEIAGIPDRYRILRPESG